MISFQRRLGREDEFFGLLEASAQECATAVAALRQITSFERQGTPCLTAFAEARRKDKAITNELEEMLIHTFVTPIEREDLEALAERLYKIPKVVEKFAERYLLVWDRVVDVEFTSQVVLLEQAMALVLEMVRALRTADFALIKSDQQKLQVLESRADDVLLERIRRLYEPGVPPLKAIILRDLFDLIEKAVDRCRDVGNVISHILLKNS
jgi:uncharacterized protein Yka (UPF0111/DUF47 family)